MGTSMIEASRVTFLVQNQLWWAVEDVCRVERVQVPKYPMRTVISVLFSTLEFQVVYASVLTMPSPESCGCS